MSSQPTFFRQVNSVDMVDYLEKIGHRPTKIRNHDFWYLSPFRQEKTASFKINRRMNAWYDHGIGKGGGLIEFGKLYYNCSVEQFLAKLEEQRMLQQPSNIVKGPATSEKKKQPDLESTIIVTKAETITDVSLVNYLASRKIPLAIASQYCEQVTFHLYQKDHLAIGFINESGGYELRNSYFKGSSSPKEPRLIEGLTPQELQVFEGFFSFLSFKTIQAQHQKEINLSSFQGNSLVLNSLSFFEKSRPLMETYNRVHLFLDRDVMGSKNTQAAQKWSKKYVDQSFRYKGSKDLNDYIMNQPKQEITANHKRGLGM